MFVGKSLTRKFGLFLVLSLILAVGAFFALKYFGYDIFSLEVVIGVFVGYVVVAIFGFYRTCVFPLKIVLRQVKLLLTGRPYQKIVTKRFDEVGILAHFFNEVTRNFEKVSSRLKEGEKVQSELVLASNIQREILPIASPQVPGLDVVAKTRFADEVGGDCFGFISKGKNVLIYIGDVTGHGLPASLVMMMVSTLLDAYAEMSDSALDVVVKTNKQLKPRIKATMFMTMLLVSWDPALKKMSYVGAGHEYLFVYRKALATVDKIPGGGIALGMVPDNSALVEEIELSLEIGDVVLLFSDGITEARNRVGEMYGEDALQKSFTDHASAYSASGIVFHMARDLAQFTGDHVQEDDMSMICIKYIGDETFEKPKEEVSTNWIDDGTKAV